MRGDLIIVGALSFFERLFGDERAKVCLKIFFQALSVDHDATLWRDRHSYCRDSGLTTPDCGNKFCGHVIRLQLNSSYEACVACCAEACRPPSFSPPLRYPS